MIALDAVYDRGNVRLLEPCAEARRTRAIVILLDPLPEDALCGTAGEALDSLEWGAPADEEAAAELIGIHEELAPYRAQAENAYVGTEEP